MKSIFHRPIKVIHPNFTVIILKFLTIHMIFNILPTLWHYLSRFNTVHLISIIDIKKTDSVNYRY